MNTSRSFGNTNVWARRVFGRGLAGNGNWTRTRGLRVPPSSATSGRFASLSTSRTGRWERERASARILRTGGPTGEGGPHNPSPRPPPRARGGGGHPFLEVTHELGRRREVVDPGLARLLRDDPGRAGAVPVRPLLGHLDPPFRFEGLEDPIDRGILDPEEPAHLLGRRDPVPKEAEVRGRLLPREAEGLQGPRRLLLPHRGCLRGLARKGFPALSSSR